MPGSATFDRIAELQVRRKYYIKLVNKQTNAGSALVRRALGWRADLDEKTRAAIAGRAMKIVGAALSGKPPSNADADIVQALAFDLATLAIGVEPFTKARHEIELSMKRAVRDLPVYPWAKSVHGFGELGLAVIVGEAGDLSKYPEKGHLWKRLGLAPYRGRAYSTWRWSTDDKLDAQEWVAGGYAPQRRAEIHAVIGDPLFRLQSMVGGPYRAVYDRRRESTTDNHPDWSKAHSHMDAMRVMTKALVRDLWVAWRAASQDLVADATE